MRSRLLLLLFFLCAAAAFPVRAAITPPVGPAPQAILIPLDNRPAPLLFTRQIARIGGAELLAPPRAILGQWFEPADFPALQRYLQVVAGNCEEAFISSDMLCFGSLVCSRTAAAPLSVALQRLDLLRQIQRPGLKVEVLATIPRLDLRTSDREAPYERVLQRWGQGADRQPPAGIPGAVTREYLGVRRRNYEVLLALLQMVEGGTVDRLVVGQDDSSPVGLNADEQHALEAEIAGRGLGSRVTLISGADELAMDMVAGWLARRYGVHPRIRVEYSDPSGPTLGPPMESLPLARTVADHLALADAQQVDADAPADACLYVATRTADAHSTVAEQKQHASALAARVSALMDGGTPVALADLEHINRADPNLAYALIGEVPIWRMEAYAGWNTSSNALGTAVAQALTHRLAVSQGAGWTEERVLESEKTQQAFLFARLADDYWYQAVLRRQMAPQVAGLPVDPNRLLNLFGPVGVQIRNELIPWAQRLFDERFKGRWVYLAALGKRVVLDRLALEVVLPWQRIFEVEIRANVSLDVQPALPAGSPSPSPAASMLPSSPATGAP